MKVGIWNVERGHRPVSHSRRIREQFDKLELDVLMLQEAREYVDQLDRLVTDAVLFAVDDRRGQDQQATLVREGLTVGRVWSFAAGDGWRLPGGKQHAGQHPLGVEVGDVELINVHAPVRDRERPAFWRDVRRELRGMGPAVVAGDLNGRPWEDGPDSPGSLFTAGFRPHPPPRGTGHGPIDWCMARGVDIGPRRVLNGWPSDHDLVTFTVRSRKGR